MKDGIECSEGMSILSSNEETESAKAVRQAQLGDLEEQKEAPQPVFASQLHEFFPGGSDSKESACNAGDLGSILRSERCPGEGNGYPLLYSCLENSMDSGVW